MLVLPPNDRNYSEIMEKSLFFKRKTVKSQVYYFWSVSTTWPHSPDSLTPYQQGLNSAVKSVLGTSQEQSRIYYISSGSRLDKQNSENTYSFQTSVGRHAHPWGNLPNA